jgi:hypothetical protein
VIADSPLPEISPSAREGDQGAKHRQIRIDQIKGLNEETPPKLKVTSVASIVDK